MYSLDTAATAAEGGMSMSELKNCENCKHRKIRKGRGYPCMCCELLNPISFNLKWEEDPPEEE